MPNTQKIEEWEKEFDCFDFGCGECEVCRYLAFLEYAQSVAPSGSTIERNKKIENYLKLKDKAISQAKSDTRREMWQKLNKELADGLLNRDFSAGVRYVMKLLKVEEDKQ